LGAVQCGGAFAPGSQAKLPRLREETLAPRGTKRQPQARQGKGQIVFDALCRIAVLVIAFNPWMRTKPLRWQIFRTRKHLRATAKANGVKRLAGYNPLFYKAGEWTLSTGRRYID